MPPAQEPTPLKKHNAYIILAVVVAFVAIGLYFLFVMTRAPQNATTNTPAGTASQIPPPSAEVVAQLKASHGFQALVSYTDRGFEPMNLVMKKGDAVRFTNNSSGDLWVAASGSSAHPVYPGTSSCGTSAFDTCKALKSGEFWEFTFAKAGTWDYANNVDKTRVGTVVAQ